MTTVGNEDAWSHKIITALVQGLMIYPQSLFPPSLARENHLRQGIQSFHNSLPHTVPCNKKMLNQSSSLVTLSNQSYNTRQGLSDDCPRSWPREHFNLSGCVNQDIPVSRMTVKEVLHLCNAERYSAHRTPNTWLPETGITSPHCQV